jgi:N-acetylneuraminate lyase
MNATAFQGIFAALVTPFDEHGNVNYGEMKRLVRYLLNRGIDGFYVCGSTGESFLLSQEERKELLETVLEENNGQKTVIAHVGNISTAFSKDLVMHACDAGADAISAVTPFYFNFSSEEILRYYFDLMDAGNKPMYVYNIPDRSGVTLTPDMLTVLRTHPLLKGVKFTSSNFFDMACMKQRHPECVIWNGMDQMLASGLAAGADGAIGSTFNVISPIAQKLSKAFFAGDRETVLKEQNKINEFISLCIGHGALKIERAILEAEGIHVGQCRRPFLPLSAKGEEAARRVYRLFMQA